MRSVNADVCYINANKHQMHSFISSIMSTNSMYDAMLETSEKNRHGSAFGGVHILVLVCIYITNICIYRSHLLVNYLSLRERAIIAPFFLVVIATHWPPKLQVNSDIFIFPEDQTAFSVLK